MNGATVTVVRANRDEHSVLPNEIDVTSVSPRPEIGWTYDGSEWLAPTPQPTTLNRLDFLRHAAGQITPDRVVDVEEGFRDSNAKPLRYAYKEYVATTEFHKDKVKEFFDAGTPQIIAQDENDLVISNWPVA